MSAYVAKCLRNVIQEAQLLLRQLIVLFPYSDIFAVWSWCTV